MVVSIAKKDMLEENRDFKFVKLNKVPGIGCVGTKKGYLEAVMVSREPSFSVLGRLELHHKFLSLSFYLSIFKAHVEVALLNVS